MQGPFNSNVAPVASTQPLVVIDAATMARVSGGAGPHGGWATPPAASSVVPAAAGPHGGWRLDPLGPHGGW